MNNSRQMADCIKKLLKAKKISAAKMLTDCSLNKNTMQTMQTGGFMPRLDTIAQIADYLDCSVDYLLGRIDTPNLNAPALPPAIKKYQLLPPDKQQSVDDVINGLYEVVRRSRQKTDEY